MTQFNEGTIEELSLLDTNGLVIMGCDGTPWKQWVDNLVNHLRQHRLMDYHDNVRRVIRVVTPQNGECLCILFNYEYDLNNLAIWRSCGRYGLNDTKLQFIKNNHVEVDDPNLPLHPFQCMWVDDFVASLLH